VDFKVGNAGSEQGCSFRSGRRIFGLFLGKFEKTGEYINGLNEYMRAKKFMKLHLAFFSAQEQKAYTGYTFIVYRNAMGENFGKNVKGA